MKVYDIRPYEQRKPTFGAAVRFSGNTSTVPEKVISIIRAKAKKIGHNNDLIMFYFGQRFIDVIPSSSGRIMQQSRNIFTKSVINNVQREKDLSYSIFSEWQNDSEIILESVNEHLSALREFSRMSYRRK